jgi:indole-3-glycerol phosphate synthase
VSKVLSHILTDVRRRLAERQAAMPLERLRDLLTETRTPRDYRAALTAPMSVIAEVKRASPSEGAISAEADPVAVARSYVEAGASALSVLTERDHFMGSYAVFEDVRRALPETPLLMKDFIVDPYQLYEARRIGADCVLIMVVVLGEKSAEYIAQARSLGLTALVEVHDEAEMRIARDAGAELVGVNNRDLTTMKVDLATSERLAALAPRGATLVSESGIKTGADMTRLARSGYSAFLVGTSLMRTGDPGRALTQLRAEAAS